MEFLFRIWLLEGSRARAKRSRYLAEGRRRRRKEMEEEEKRTRSERRGRRKRGREKGRLLWIENERKSLKYVRKAFVALKLSSARRLGMDHAK
ncbi:unnamed protein product [Dovyalis caffra]|uniref:Uncharacterized protein n=1 Tax=Dovyalis caffra TaxID=77055 RepID=A0AAV1QM94_9ROSI|nr:unnamed protein product [Dovyalis caffra]